MAGIHGQQPPDHGCDRCQQRDPAPTMDWVLSALQLSLGLAETGHNDATAIAVASLLVIRLGVELYRVFSQSDR